MRRWYIVETTTKASGADIELISDGHPSHSKVEAQALDPE